MDSIPACPLTVTVDTRLTAEAPGYVLGLIAVGGIDVVKDAPAVEARLTAAEDRLHTERFGKAGVAALPTIAAWRETYRAVRRSPNSGRTSSSL